MHTFVAKFVSSFLKHFLTKQAILQIHDCFCSNYIYTYCPTFPAGPPWRPLPGPLRRRVLPPPPPGRRPGAVPPPGAAPPGLPPAPTPGVAEAAAGVQDRGGVAGNIPSKAG